MTERRASERVHVELRVDERTEGALYFQRATSLSESGVYLEGTLPHPPGTEVELDLHLPGHRRALRLRGRVAARDLAVGMGVRFVDLGAESRDRIADYLARRSA